MTSTQVDFQKAHYPEGSVEFWMTDILEEMKATVQWKIVESCKDYVSRDRNEWVLLWPGATIIAGSTIFWTVEVEKALREKGNAGLVEYYGVSHEQLMGLTRTVAGKITKLQRKSLGALITIDVHARDVVSDMRDAGVSEITSFDWIK